MRCGLISTSKWCAIHIHKVHLLHHTILKDDSYGQKAYLDEMSPRQQHQQLRHQIHRLQHRLRLGHDQGPGRAFRQRKEDARSK